MKKYCSYALLCAVFQASLGDEAKNSESVQSQVRLDKSIVRASMMSTKLDELNRNVYEIDKESILDKGYRSTEDIFRYTPFVGLANVGLGGNLDLRGQGNRANTSVQVLINGVYANMLDSSHGVTPLNTLSPSSIESIEILPGGGAVMYGNGTRGGVVNIITQRRYEQPFFSAGLSYSNILASTGNNYNADAKFGTKIGEDTYLSLGAAYINRGGPRVGDKTSGAQVNMGVIKDFSGGGRSSLSFDIDYFYGLIDTTPNNSFMDISNPTKNDRKRAGNGDFHNTQQRLDVSVGYKSQVSENATFDIKAFYHLNRIKYVDSITNLTNYRYNNMITFTRTSADQSGSLFDDQKVGLSAKYDLRHSNGRFVLGLESLYSRGKRTMEQVINATGGSGNMQGQSISNASYFHPMSIPFVGTKWSNALYALEKYDFTQRFSLTGGARYENALYDVNVENIQRINVNMGQQQINTSSSTKGSLKDSLHNFALEMSPNYHYSDSGNIYAKYERGFFSPSPNSMLQRVSINRVSQYTNTNLKQESYDTFEVGFKDFFGEVAMISASGFYTLTHNEFYTIGNAHSASGVWYGNYDKTQRIGVELFSQQYFFGGRLSLSESFTYIDARILKNNGVSVKDRIPYVSNYKGTFGINLALGKHWNVWSQNTFYGNQKDISGESMKAYSLTDIGLSGKFGDLSLSGGVRNVFDTFYYSYYNGDSSDSIAGYGFLIGQGRSAFIEGRWSF
ncbi:TonB-dependent receptor [Helicobacter sp. MIT 21-1697]|uniref:TonB-dependent receptor n=1 Tax=Helicobacter sp. MIT 21-1697 TaxID=2993733 RepID=UPI00224ADFF2|nr:TonB-dependent receptor plug domain-containing protein [Helicobacter sp. MIT 21-1697]MCX2716291.1 TonB-dependent receptor [Helicobacter sp. MIT 21-1697]